MITVNILAGDLESANSQSLLFPLIQNQNLIAENGIRMKFYNCEVSNLADCDALFIDSKYFKPYWSDRSDVAINKLHKLSQDVESIAWFHTGDSAGALGDYARLVMPYVKLFFKSQAYRDKSLYLKNIYGNRLYTDYYYREFSIKDTSPALQDSKVLEGDIDKIRVSWNIAYARCFTRFGNLLTKIYRTVPMSGLLETIPKFEPVRKERVIPLHYRMGLGFSRETIAYQRIELAKLLGRLSKVSRVKYYQEMRRSKVVVSPFGWGEINNRDFEALISGCLLVKPTMSHLETYPNLFVENETMLSYNWNLLNMDETIQESIVNYAKYIDLAIEAQRRYKESVYTQSGRRQFVERVVGLVHDTIDAP